MARFFTLLLLTASLSLGQGLPPGVLAEVDYETRLDNQFQASFAQTALHSWVGTAGGVFRLPLRIEEGEAERIGFAGRLVERVYADDEHVWVLKETADYAPGEAPDPGLVRTDDHGGSFVPLDDTLETCFGDSCQRMAGSELVFRDGRVYYAAGGNVLASPDGGETWVALVGFLEPQLCYNPSIEIIGDRVLVGGECPLDIAYVRAGTLKPGTFEWESEPEAVVTPELENRNVQFIHHRPESSIVFAGIEGALLRSFDLGASFDFVIWYESTGAGDGIKYPYIGSLVEPSSYPGVVMVGGFDKAAEANGAWLAISRDGGETWRDISASVTQPDGFRADSVSFLEEDRDGRVLAGLVDMGSNRLRIVKLDLEPARRRVVRR